VTALSGETGAPVAGARFVVGGRTYVADGGGVASLTEAADFGSLVDVQAPGFLDRQTLLRSADGTRFVLWPRTTVTGLSETYTGSLVYTQASATPPPVGATPLRRHRLGTTQIVIVLSADLRQDVRARAAHQDAVATLNAAHAGRLSYVLASESPTAGVVFEVRVDPADPQCQGLTRAYTSLSLSGQEITGGRMVYCTPDTAETPTAAHELGHTAGLQHSPDPAELMGAVFVRGRSDQLGVRETLALKLMSERRAGNRFPDNDRDLAQSGERTVTITCP
jgi:hypothetical protein